MSSKGSHDKKLQPVRIGSGSMCGRKLMPPPGRGTRPMTGMAKKSIFGTIMPFLGDSMVLDLYCGTGTLGLEAISNGAAKVYFAEANHKVAERLKRNIIDCQVENISVIWQGDIERKLRSWLESMEGSFDIAFVDPPFPNVRKWDFSSMEEKIFAPLAEKISPDGMVLLRVPGDIALPEKLGGLTLSRSKNYGDMDVGFYGI